MSEASPIEGILSKAKDEERRFEWLKAADYYHEALIAAAVADFSKKGDVCEYQAYALYKAAFQAEKSDEFRGRIQRAVEEYEKAKQCYERRGDNKRPEAFRCDAMIAFCGYWLASDALGKRTLIDKCWTMTKKAMIAFREQEKPLECAKTFVQLSQSALWRIFLEGEYLSILQIVEEARLYGEQAIMPLSNFGDNIELGKAYFQTAIYTELVGLNTPDHIENERYTRKAENYALKAKQVCEEAVLLESYYIIGFDLGTEETKAFLNKQLEFAYRTKDRFIIGWALALLSNCTLQRRLTAEDAQERTKLLEKTLNYAEKARNEFRKLSWLSPPMMRGFWVEAPYTYYYSEMALEETDMDKRRDLLQKTVESAPEEFRLAKDSGYPQAEGDLHHVLSKALVSLATTETNFERKNKILEEAFEHRKQSKEITRKGGNFGAMWLGLELNSLADIEYRIANLTADPSNRIKTLQEALRIKEEALGLYKKDLAGFLADSKAMWANYGRSQYDYGEMLNRLNELTGDKEDFKRTVGGFADAAEAFQKAGLASRRAECCWKSAQVYDVLGEHLKAAHDFLLASEDYKAAADKTPKLNDFYEKHSIYMSAWSEIEKARYHHERQEYGRAEEHFRKAAELHESSKDWSYMAPSYAAWSIVEYAEELSRKEKDEEALERFQQAADLFEEAKKSIQLAPCKIEKLDKQMATDLLRATDIRHGYCKARIAIEEAKILDKKGEHHSSFQKYGSAVEILEKLTQTPSSETDKREFQFIAYLSRAWQKMAEAEAEESPLHYEEASQLFENSKDLGQSEKTKTLMLGHSRFCLALEAGARFADTRDVADYASAMQYLESAGGYYLKADFKSASDYVKATRFLFDAYVQMGNAARETDLEKKSRLYMVAEKVLQASADSYGNAGNPSRKEQALKLLKTVQEQREMAISLTEVLHAPIISSTTAFSAPSPTSEKAVGLETFEHAEVNANLIVSRRELKVGESLDLEIELANAGKGQALLIQIEGAVPEGFEVTKKPELYRVEGFNLNMKGRRLDPLMAEEVRLGLKSKRRGSFTMRPRILYVDENGNPKSHQPESVIITVGELGIKGWIKGDE